MDTIFRRLLVSILSCGLLAVPVRSWAEQTNWPAFGVRSGFSSTDIVTPFWTTEAFSTWEFPKVWQLGAQFTLTPRIEITAGVLRGHGETGFVGALGPGLVLRYGKLPLTMDGGLGATWLSREEYGDRDFGYPLEFTSHLGLDWEFYARWKLGYRFQHMSNASFGHSNPGLNTHLFGLAYQF